MNLKGKGLFQRLKEGLSKTRHEFVSKVDRLILNRRKIDDQFLEELEEIMLAADLGVRVTHELIGRMKNEIRRKELNQPEVLKGYLRDEIYEILKSEEKHLEISEKAPFVIMVIGVNGVGKTTIIGKMASRFISQDKSVLLVAADTFRTAAIEQLQIWGERAGVEVISQQMGSDPAAVVFDAIKSAQARKVDVLIIDTAGRMHTKTNLIEELKKIKRVIARVLTGAPHEILLILDATTGQNSISQAKLFDGALGVTGIAVTKLDGTSRGGVLVAISSKLNIPIRYIGIGEKIEDLRDFNAREFVNAIL
jgi:fused signal recognition particle receptor